MRRLRATVFFIVIILVFSLLVTACDQIVETTPSSSPAITSISPAPSSLFMDDPFEITLVECQFYGEDSENPDWKEIWPRLVEDRFGVKITMVTPARTNYMQTIQAAAKSGDINGIVELFGGPYVESWKSMDLIYPLTEFLSENEVWNTIIPEHWKEAYEIDGEVWAIPAGSDGSISWFTRSIRGDWLDKLKLEKPYTINEFYEASYSFTYKDPDGNGKDDTIGFTAGGPAYLSDIFAAYDARLNPNYGNTLVWNPNTDLWEDSMLKPEMVECLEFLRKCFSEGILDQASFSGQSGADVREKISSVLYGGTVYWDSWILSFESKVQELVPDAYFVCVGALSHNIDTNLNGYSLGSGGMPRVLLKNTPQPKETINWYLNTFFGDDWGFWTGRIGPVGDYPGQEERACTVENNTILRNTYIDSAGSIKTYPNPGFIGGLPSRALYTVYEIAYYAPSPPKGFETWAEDTANRAMENITRRNSWLDEYIENGMAYQLSQDLMGPSSSDFYEIRAEIDQITYDAISAAITGETSITDAIENYKSLTATLGVERILHLENEKLKRNANQGN